MARTVQIATGLATIPLTIHYLGDERFGLWMTINSLLAIASFADLGIGNGVLNVISNAYGKNDWRRIRLAISSGFAVLAAIGAASFAIIAVSLRFISVADSFKLTTDVARAEAGPALLVFGACFAVNIPLDLIQRVQLGLQQGFRMNLWQACGSVVGLIGVMISIHVHAPLSVLVGSLAGGPLLATAINGLHFFGTARPDIRPRLKLVSIAEAKFIVKFGSLFFLLQLVAAAAYSSDNLVIAQTLGASHVTDYSIAQKMFLLISTTVAILITPLWPAYGEAISRGEFSWVRATLRNSLLSVLMISSIGSIAVALLFSSLARWWIGREFDAPPALVCGLAVWTVVECGGNVLSMFLNGASVVRFQVIVASLFGVVCVAVKIYSTRRFGIVAVPWSTVAAYLSIPVMAYAFYVPRLLKNLQTSPPLLIRTSPPRSP